MNACAVSDLMRPRTKQVRTTPKSLLKTQNKTKTLRTITTTKQEYRIHGRTEVQCRLGPAGSKGGARLALTVLRAAGLSWADAGSKQALGVSLSVAWSAAL